MGNSITIDRTVIILNILFRLILADVTPCSLLTHKSGNISILASSISQKSVDKLPNK